MFGVLLLKKTNEIKRKEKSDKNQLYWYINKYGVHVSKKYSTVGNLIEYYLLVI
jgi:hypothetical protein